MSETLKYELKFNNLESLMVLYQSVKTNVKSFELFLSKEETIACVFDNLTSITYATTPKEFSYISKEKNTALDMKSTVEEVEMGSFNDLVMQFANDLDWDDDFYDEEVCDKLPDSETENTDSYLLDNPMKESVFELSLTLPLEFLLAVYNLKNCYIEYNPNTRKVLLISTNSDTYITFEASTLKLKYDFYKNMIKDLKFEQFNLKKVKAFLKTVQSITDKNILNTLSIKEGKIYQTSDYMLVESSLNGTAGSYLIENKALSIINRVKVLRDKETVKIGALKRGSIGKLAICAYEDLLIITPTPNKPQMYLFDKIDKSKITPEFIISEELVEKLKFVGRFLEKNEDIKLEIYPEFCKLNQLNITSYSPISNLSGRNLKITLDYFTILNIIKMTDKGKQIKVSLYKLKENNSKDGKYLGIFSSNVTTVVKLTGVIYDK